MLDHQSSWYVARLKPGASREAPVRLNAPIDRYIETIAERSLRDAGFEVYFPRMRKEIVHHRTRKLLVRAFPLFTGYAFVDAVSKGKVRATECDGISEIMGVKIDGRPWPVSSAIVDQFRAAEENEVFDNTKSARIRRLEEGRTARETAMMRYPAGTQVSIKNQSHSMAGFHGMVVSVSGRGMVKAMMNLFGGLVPVEVDLGDLEVVSQACKIIDLHYT